jgi:hypothetical protein
MTNHTISASEVAVDKEYYWQEVNKDTPRFVKLQLLSRGGIACHGVLQPKDDFYTHWTPLPRRKLALDTGRLGDNFSLA